MRRRGSECSGAHPEQAESLAREVADAKDRARLFRRKARREFARHALVVDKDGLLAASGTPQDPVARRVRVSQQAAAQRREAAQEREHALDELLDGLFVNGRRRHVDLGDDDYDGQRQRERDREVLLAKANTQQGRGQPRGVKRSGAAQEQGHTLDMPISPALAPTMRRTKSGAVPVKPASVVAR